ncbi:MAG: HEPN domain-containing protein [Candidatus Brocadiia bacterium]
MGDEAARWFEQSDYDMETARFLLEGGRYVHSVFMCHLAVEKALPGLWTARLGSVPPKTHNLIYLASKAGIEPNQTTSNLFATLNEAQIATRYPGELTAARRAYPKEVVRELLARSEEALEWIKSKL